MFDPLELLLKFFFYKRIWKKYIQSDFHVLKNKS